MEPEFPRIIRQQRIGISDAQAHLDESIGEERPVGVPASRDVQMPPARVIRRGAASLGAMPVEVAEIDYVPDYPLPVTPESPRAPEAPAPPDPAILKAQWDAEWEQRLASELARAREEAFESGYRSAMAEMQESYQKKSDAFEEDVEHFRQLWNEFLASCEPLMAELAFGVVQAILDAPLPAGLKGVAGRALTEAVESLRGNAPLEISLHPVDFLRLQESGIVDQLEALNSGIRWEPTTDLKHGEWTVQSPVSVIRRLDAELLEAIKNRVGLLTALQDTRSSTRKSD